MAEHVSDSSDRAEFFELSPNLLSVSSIESDVLQLNDAWRDVMGWTISNLGSTSLIDLVHPDDRDRSISELEKLRNGDGVSVREFENRVRASDGTYHSIEWTARQRHGKIFASGTDVSSQTRNRLAFAESLETTRAIFDAAIDSIVVVDRDLNILDTSAGSELLHGFPTSERTGGKVIDLVHPEDVAAVNEAISRAFEEGATLKLNFRLRHVDGHFVPVEVRGRAFHSDAGLPTRMIFIARDNTEAIASKAALAESIATTKAIFEAAVDGIVMINRDFEVVVSNSASEHMYGRTSLERLGKPTLEIVHPEDMAKVAEAALRLFTDDEIVTVRYRVRHRDGQWVTLESRGQGLANPDGPTKLAVFIARDISKSVESEEALAASIETRQAILQAAPDSIIMVDRDLNVLDASPGTQRIYGLSPEERQGRSALNIVHPDDRHRVEEALHEFFRSDEKELFGIRFRAVHADGHTLVIEARGLLIPDTVGRSPRAVIVARDISESVAAEAALAESVAKTGAILEAAPDSIIMIDRNLLLVESSPGTERMFGISQAEREGQLVYNIVHRDDQPAVVAALKRLFMLDVDDTITIRFRARRIDGTWLRVESRGRLLRSGDDQELRAVLVSRDITEEFAAQEAMKEAKETAEQANRAKSEFMSRMSHELRTPLNSVLGFSQILQMELTSPDQRDLVEHIFKSGSHLLELINEVLDISRVESGHINVVLEAVSLSDVVAECVRIVTPQADELNISLDVDERMDFLVLADKQRLTQVVLNLLSNAIKFNNDPGTVRLHANRRGEMARLSVTDSGPGIEQSLQPRLFTAFDRLDADRKGIDGTGLGLALSRSLIEAINGTIGVESAPDAGSTFWIELPLTDIERTAVTPLAPRTAPPSPSHADATILYIEDNIANVHLVDRLLMNRPSVHLVTSLTGGLGIELAQQLVPALILLDVHLPDLHGFDVLQRLRADPRTESIPVIVLSADATEWQTGRFLEAGASGYLTKPFDLHRLLDILDEYLGAAPFTIRRHVDE
ncbi:MAG TPA: PAS domain S-box protein [Acidimicrobiales bacterium]